jgi:hypothetical protein
MAPRRPSAPTPQPANLSVEQMKRGIVAINRRIADLERFEPAKIPERGHPDVTALEKSIEETLSDVSRIISAIEIQNTRSTTQGSQAVASKGSGDESGRLHARGSIWRRVTRLLGLGPDTGRRRTRPVRG